MHKIKQRVILYNLGVPHNFNNLYLSPSFLSKRLIIHEIEKVMAKNNMIFKIIIITSFQKTS